MAESLVGSLFSSLDMHSISDIASSLGESEQAVSTGMRSSLAAILSKLAGKAGDPNALRQIVDQASNTVGDVSPSKIVGAVHDPNSSLLSGGKRMLSSLFGNEEGSILNAVSGQSGLRSSTASTLMALAAPMVMSNLVKRVRDEHMSFSALGGLLQGEGPSIRSALPNGLSDVPPRAAGATAGRETRDLGSPVVAQATMREKTSSIWPMLLGLLALLAVVLGIIYSMRRPVQRTIAPVANSLGNFVRSHLPNNVDLNIPERGVEARLLQYIQDPTRPAGGDATQFQFDRLLFDTGSATLRPESEEQLNNIASIMKAYPNVNIKVGGYTDNVGDSAQNLKLSQDRAEAVVAGLERSGIAANRLSAQGYGEQYPVADNSTDDGRARNRRVSMQVTRK
jgi:outer membrane protein OmpA-like peptidoglycan-associated protein